MVEQKTNNKKINKSKTNKNNKHASAATDYESLAVVVLKLDMHCAGCVNKIVKYVKSMQGVESAKPDTEASKLTVIGRVDPLKLKEKLEFKTKRKVDLITPLAKKDNKGQNNDANNDNGSTKKKVDEKVEKKTEEKKAKEPQLSTAVLKVALHCQGCIDKINRIVTRFKGVVEMLLDKQNDKITVKGTMDAKALAGALKERLKRAVEIVPPPKKDKEEKKKNGGDKENGEEKKENGGKKDKENGGKKEKEDGGGKMEESKMVLPTSYGCSSYVYGYPGYIEHLHAPQMFSDENPNACSIM